SGSKDEAVWIASAALWWVDKLYSHDNGDSGLRADAQQGALTDSIFDNNTGDGAQFGATAFYTRIKGCHFQFNDGHGMDTDASRSTISDCTFLQNDHGIFIGGASYLTVSTCSFKDTRNTYDDIKAQNSDHLAFANIVSTASSDAERCLNFDNVDFLSLVNILSSGKDTADIEIQSDCTQVSLGTLNLSSTVKTIIPDPSVILPMNKHNWITIPKDMNATIIGTNKAAYVTARLCAGFGTD
ncbi:unnamed protein product, partial [marine sediment metagenome]